MLERPTVADLVFAVRYLTILPASLPASLRASWGSGRLGPATLFFPAVGLLLGAAVAIVDWWWGGFGAPLRSGLAVVLLAGLGRFEAPRALWKVGVAAGSGGDRATALQALRGGGGLHVGMARATALALISGVFLLKLWALWGEVALRSWALLLAPMLGRWAMVVVAFSARRARVGAPGARFEAGITFREFGWASVFATGVCLVGLEAIGLLAVLAAVFVAVGLRLVWHRWLGGVSEATFHASGELAETAVLLVFAALRAS